MAVVKNGSSATAATSGAGASSLTLSSFVVAGSLSNSVLYVTLNVTTGNATPTTSLKYGGVDLTKIATWVRGTSLKIEVWRLLSPAAGTANIVATFGTTTRGGMVAQTYTGVDQTTPESNLANANNSSATASCAVSSNLNDFVFGAVCIAGGDSVTMTVNGAGQTDDGQSIFASGAAGNSGRQGISESTGAATSTTVSWSLSGGTPWVAGGFVINPPAAVTVTISTGVSASTAVGTPSVTITSPVTVTGVGISVDVTTNTVSIDVTVHVDGVASPAVVGTPVPSIAGVVAVSLPDGVAASCAIGTLIPVVVVFLTGQLVLSKTGTVGVVVGGNINVNVVGVAADSAIGNVQSAIAQNLFVIATGVEADVSIGGLTLQADSPNISLIIVPDTQPAIHIVSSQDMNDIYLNNNLEIGWLLSSRDPATGLPIPATGLAGVQSWISASIGGTPLDPSVSISLTERTDEPGAYFGTIDGSVITAILGARTDGSLVYLVLGIGTTVGASEPMYVRFNRVIQAA